MIRESVGHCIYVYTKYITNFVSLAAVVWDEQQKRVCSQQNFAPMMQCKSSKALIRNHIHIPYWPIEAIILMY